jgi:hypothetical protein
MFRLILMVLFVSILIWFIRYKEYFKKIQYEVKNQSNKYVELFRAKDQNKIITLRGVTFLILLLFFLILALSSFLPIIVFGAHLSGIFLIIHVTVAPLFAISLALFVILWAHSLRFTDQNWQYIQKLSSKGKSKISTKLKKDFWYKINFWLFLCASLPAILSIILSLYPIFETQHLEGLLQIHRYSTLLMFIIMVIHLYLSMIREIVSQSVKNENK